MTPGSAVKDLPGGDGLRAGSWCWGGQQSRVQHATRVTDKTLTQAFVTVWAEAVHTTSVLVQTVYIIYLDMQPLHCYIGRLLLCDR